MLKANRINRVFVFEDLLLTSDLAEFNIELQCVIVLSLVRDFLDSEDFTFDVLRLSFDKPPYHQGYEDFLVVQLVMVISIVNLFSVTINGH